jgi:UPF0176 protein
MQGDCYHISFYRLVALAMLEADRKPSGKRSDAEFVVYRLRVLAANLLGAVLVADEGINGMLAGSAAELDRFEQRFLREFPIFAGMTFKRTHCAKAPFGKLKIHLKREVVNIGRDVGALRTEQQQLMHELSPTEWDALLACDDVVVLDNRNHFEYQLGRFENAVDPQVQRYQDFAEYVEANLEQWQQQGKKLAMYCTGGIRCEKTAQWLAAHNIESFSLQGGILSYLQHRNDLEKDSGSWQGECFVFDRRHSLDGALEQGRASLEQIYQGPEEAWRLARAKRLADSE